MGGHGDQCCSRSSATDHRAPLSNMSVGMGGRLALALLFLLGFATLGVDAASLCLRSSLSAASALSAAQVPVGTVICDRRPGASLYWYVLQCTTSKLRAISAASARVHGGHVSHVPYFPLLNSLYYDGHTLDTLSGFFCLIFKGYLTGVRRVPSGITLLYYAIYIYIYSWLQVLPMLPLEQPECVLEGICANARDAGV